VDADRVAGGLIRQQGLCSQLPALDSEADPFPAKRIDKACGVTNEKDPRC